MQTRALSGAEHNKTIYSPCRTVFRGTVSRHDKWDRWPESHPPLNPAMVNRQWIYNKTMRSYRQLSKQRLGILTDTNYCFSTG